MSTVVCYKLTNINAHLVANSKWIVSNDWLPDGICIGVTDMNV